MIFNHYLYRVQKLREYEFIKLVHTKDMLDIPIWSL